MKELYGQKMVPDIDINHFPFECLTSFELKADSEGYVNIACETSILFEGAKQMLLSKKTIGKYLIVYEPSRKVSDGADVTQKTLFIIKQLQFEYCLDYQGEPARYKINMKCEYYG